MPVPETEPPPLGLSEGGEERSTRGNPVLPMRDRPAKPLRALLGSLLFLGNGSNDFRTSDPFTRGGFRVGEKFVLAIKIPAGGGPGVKVPKGSGR